jgi:hypothetical protein
VTLPRREILLSQLLTLHLDLSLRRYKGPKKMSKFTELAELSKTSLKDWDEQAGELLSEGLKLKARGDAVFEKHRAKQAEAHAGFAAMEEAVRELEGDNGAPNEGGATGFGSSSSSFPETPIHPG